MILPREIGKERCDHSPATFLIEQRKFFSARPHLEDDEDDFGGGFEMELANMDLDGGEHMIGEGPENQQTCVKWVGFCD